MGSLSTTAVVLASLCSNLREGVARDHVDLIEVNHFYDETGKLVFDQVIFYDWSVEHGRYNVRDWKLLKKTGQIPVRNWSKGEFLAVWYDGDTLRVVRSSSVRESWTQYDPELLEREYFPKEKRAGLMRVAGKTASR